MRYTAEEEVRLYSLAKSLLNNTFAGSPADTAAALAQVLRHADWRYYVQSEAQLADVEYDQLFKALIALEEAHPELRSGASPTQRVAQALSERFPPVAHLVPMLSLDNTYNAQDLTDWDRRVQAGAAGEKVEYCVEPKYDGASVSLIYENGRLVRGATRGDGVMGEDITANTRQIRTLPLSAPLAGISTLEIRGEVVIHKGDFAEYNRRREEKGLSTLANPRNAASGTLRMLDSAEVRDRKLTAILYHVSEATPPAGESLPAAFETHYDTLQWLYQHGFPTPAQELRVFSTIEDVIAWLEDFEVRRDALPFEIDGAVIKVNNIALQEKLGMTSHHPRWAVAYKFAARQATSILQNVIFNVNRTGSVTPVAKITPVPIGGVMVSSATLFNQDFIEAKDLRIGDTVLVERAGDVIPYLVKCLPELRTGTEQPIVFPHNCPVCDSVLEREVGDPMWRCLNAACPAQAIERIIHFGSKDALDIRGLGERALRKFFEAGVITGIASLYTINWAALAGTEGFGDKRIENLQSAIEASKKQPLYRLVFGLGIPNVGEGLAKTIAGAVSRLQDLYDFTEEQLKALPDVGPKVAASVIHFFSKEENRALIAQLEALGLQLHNDHRQLPVAGGNLEGKTFLFTGTMPTLKRSDAEALVEAQGGKLLSGVSAKLNYLVAGEAAGSKLEKARRLGSVAILNEDDLLALLAAGNAPESASYTGTESDISIATEEETAPGGQIPPADGQLF
jgi:DNA ligase (NAD+)